MFNYIIGGLFVLIVFSIAYAYLKPHRLHHSRPLSTLALKGSYLVYLLVTLLVIYFASLSGGGLSEVFDGPEFFVFLLVLLCSHRGHLLKEDYSFQHKESTV
ncbi:MAG: hypothetical protein MZV63_37610 [Marinilabiliales bacterium]|nr:hypothetical protein [Marinilabiliales bacterium]